MNYNLIILPKAAKDIGNAAKWYNKKSLGLGNRFVFNVNKKATFIKIMPYSFAIKYGNVRTTLVDKFPYLIHYFVDEINKEVLILAVLHTSRNPDIWKSLYKA